MKNFTEIFNRFHHFPKLIVVIMIGSLGFLGACSSDDETTAIVDTSGVSAYNFTTDNSRIAAEIAAAAMEFFPTFNQISIAMLEILAGETYPPGNSLPLLLCTNAPTGTAVLSWVDDGSGNLTVGDTANLNFINCDVDSSGEAISGDVNFEAVDVTLPTSVGISVSLALKLDLGTGETTGVVGNFGFTVETIDQLNFTNVYTADNDSGQTITITENGVPYFKAGCLDVTQTYYIDDVLLGYYNLAASGVINAGNQILSLKSGPAVGFMGGDMYFGTQGLLSTSVPDECGSVGAPLGIPKDSDGSYMDMEAPGGGLLILSSFKKDGTPIYTEETFWSTLTD